MADIRKMFAELDMNAPEFSGTFTTEQGNTYECFNLPKVIPIGVMNKIKTLVKPKKPLPNAGDFVIICFIQISNGSRTPLKVLGVGRFFLTVFDPTPIFHLRKFL